MLEQGFFLGQIRHHRYAPKKHLFHYSMYWSLLDLDLLESTEKQYNYFSNESFNVLSFKRQDFFKRNNKSTKESIQGFIREKAGKPFSGRIFLLSHLRFLGFNFNSVSFYFCINESGDLEYILAEITNTPWGERHTYLLNCEQSRQRSNCYLFDFYKEFHISPFVSMNMKYQWLFKIEDEQLRIHMKINSSDETSELFQSNKLIDVTFTGKQIPLTQSNLNKMILKYPFQPLKMVWGIYWQALKLWLKKIPFFSHPKHATENNH